MLKYKIIFLKIVPLLLFFLAGCATAPPQRHAGKIHLKDLCERNDVQWLLDSVSLVITLRYDDVEAKALTESDIVIMGTQKILLSGPVIRERGVVIVPKDFERKIVQRLIEKRVVSVPRWKSTRRPYKIVIDAGHGGKDPGSTGKTGIKEKEVVLDIAKRLRSRLEQNGFKVKMTRHQDTFISLAERTEITSRANADLFISVHANSSPVRGVRGLEVFSHKELGKKEKREEQRLKNHDILFKSLTMKRNYPQLEKTISELLDRYKWSRSWIAASYVAKGVSRSARVKNRGIKRSGFFVLRNTLIPAVLVEVGFLSNPREEELLKTSSHRQKLADALAESLVRYVNR